MLERLVNRTLDAAVVLLPEGDAPPGSVDGERLGTETLLIVAAKSNQFPRSLRLKDISSTPWILNPNGCGARSMLETALLRQGLPLMIAVEAEGNDLHLSQHKYSSDLGCMDLYGAQSRGYRGAVIPS